LLSKQDGKYFANPEGLSKIETYELLGQGREESLLLKICNYLSTSLILKLNQK